MLGVRRFNLISYISSQNSLSIHSKNIRKPKVGVFKGESKGKLKRNNSIQNHAILR